MKEKVKVFELIDFDATIGNQKVLVGTMNDIRIWTKNMWSKNVNYAKSIVDDENITEEDYYTLLDDDKVLTESLIGIGYGVREICEVPFDDFYDDQKPTQELIDEVLFQIKVDIAEGDLTALDEMLKAMPVQQLISYLPEKLN